MKEQYIDLHVHSTSSDGTFTPSELVTLGLKKGLKAFALTDHDTTAGIREAQEAARGTDLTVIPGIELSTAWKNRDIHILGLNIEPENVYFQDKLRDFQIERETRNHKIIRKMQEQGLSISYGEMLKLFPDSVWTRAHFARYLMETHQVHTIAEAFNRFLGDHAPCFVPREKVTPFQAVQLIHHAGGKAILAHPLLYHLTPEQLDELTSQLVKSRLDGIEAIYSSNKGMDETNMRRLARKYNLFITGGSDFHGSNKPTIDMGCGKGNLKIPSSLLKNL
ncbi:MAG: PHP domain-containing protein [Oliverpabstia sp.]